ncbi:hypothetical protein cyc_06839 [Cyclospora cayetanensis]|uniref:Uncharacterized protein n=1 Tax=Cyclospora cayetanensis TaxID=88456 RepID=A0A1D3CZP3_9EIME|nr:hypothetical protein cyc_06839 [Cyclospora cayetanensis]
MQHPTHPQGPLLAPPPQCFCAGQTETRAGSLELLGSSPHSTTAEGAPLSAMTRASSRERTDAMRESGQSFP